MTKEATELPAALLLATALGMIDSAKSAVLPKGEIGGRAVLPTPGESSCILPVVDRRGEMQANATVSGVVGGEIGRVVVQVGDAPEQVANQDRSEERSREVAPRILNYPISFLVAMTGAYCIASCLAA